MNGIGMRIPAAAREKERHDAILARLASLEARVSAMEKAAEPTFAELKAELASLGGKFIFSMNRDEVKKAIADRKAELAAEKVAQEQ